MIAEAHADTKFCAEAMQHMHGPYDHSIPIVSKITTQLLGIDVVEGKMELERLNNPA